MSFTVDRLDEYEHVREVAASFQTIDFGLKDLIAVADEIAMRSVAP